MLPLVHVSFTDPFGPNTSPLKRVTSTILPVLQARKEPGRVRQGLQGQRKEQTLDWACTGGPEMRALAGQPPGSSWERYLDSVFSFFLTQHRRRCGTEGEVTLETLGGRGTAEDQVKMLEP